MASMQDIADKLGISKATVSLVLSGKGKNRIGDDTIKLVEQTANELNYHVNSLARGLRTGKTNTIGVLVTDISNEFFGQFVFNIQEEAKKHGYLVLSANTNENSNDFEDAVNMMISNKVDGIIAVPTIDSYDYLKKILDRKIPLVMFDRYCQNINADYVGINNYGVTRKSVNDLIRQGYKNVAMLNYDLSLNALREREMAYRDEMLDYKMLDEAIIKSVDYEAQDKEVDDAIRELFSSEKPIDAIFFSCRRIFMTSMKHMYELGVDKINGKKFLCFDEVDSFLMSYMNIDCIKQPIREMGVKSFRLLLDKINGGEYVDRYLFEAMLISNIYTK